jgi:hypothetical protein
VLPELLSRMKPATAIRISRIPATTLSDMVPYLVVMGAGFLVGAWGQSARVPLAVVAGILLILIAVAGFILDNSSGSTGIPGFSG